MRALSNRLIFIATFSLNFSLLSCDPVGCLDVEIQNDTNQELTLNWYATVESFNKSKSIGQGERLLIDEDSYCDVGGKPTQLSYEVFDSIVIFSQQNEVLKVWTPDSESKNIFDTANDWQLRSTGRWDSAILFVINASDLGQTP